MKCKVGTDLRGGGEAGGGCRADAISTQSPAARDPASADVTHRLIVEVPTPGQTAVRVASSSLSAHSLARARDRVLACFVGVLACVSAPFFCSQVFFAPKAPDRAGFAVLRGFDDDTRQHTPPSNSSQARHGFRGILGR